MGWFTAAYAGVCVECDGEIVPGQQVERTGGGYAHAVCPAVPSVELRATEVVCGSCFVVKPCACDDGQWVA